MLSVCVYVCVFVVNTTKHTHMHIEIEISDCSTSEVGCLLGMFGCAWLMSFDSVYTVKNGWGLRASGC